MHTLEFDHIQQIYLLSNKKCRFEYFILFQRLDDKNLKECCQSIKRLALSPRGEGALGTGDKVMTLTDLALFFRHIYTN